METVRAFLRGNKLGNRVSNTGGAIVDACCGACAWLTAQPERITAIGTRGWVRVTA